MFIQTKKLYYDNQKGLKISDTSIKKTKKNEKQQRAFNSIRRML